MTQLIKKADLFSISRFNPQDLRVVFGEHDREIKTESQTSEHRIKSAKFHPKFDLFTFNNDIAVVELDSSVPIGGHIRTACLPDDGNWTFIQKKKYI